MVVLSSKNLSIGLGISVFSAVLLICSFAMAKPKYVEGEVIVKLKSQGSSKTNFSKNQDFVSKATSFKGVNLKGSWSALGMHHFAKPGQSVEQTISDFKQDPDVEYAEPNYIIEKQEVVTGQATTQGYSQAQVRTFTSPGVFSMTAANINANSAWSSLVGTNVPVVAVIDTGIDLNHIAFSCGAVYKNLAEINGVAGRDDDGNGYVDDYNGWNFVSNNNSPQDDDGHGTHVSGIILGTGQDLFGCGDATNQAQRDAAAAKVKILPLKFLDANGSGTTADAIKAIYYAVNQGAKVLNNSWGGSEYSRALHEAIVYSYNARTVFVAAAGNMGTDNGAVAMYPANFDVPNVISVAATNSADTLAGFSNYSRALVHMGSPGVSILSSLPGNNYGYLSGTSMAAPFVSGAAAMVLHESSLMNGYQVKKLVTTSGLPISSLNGKTTTGARLDLYGAVNKAQTTAVDPYMPPYAMKLSSEDRGLASALATSGGGCGMVKVLSGSGSEGGGSGGGWATGFALMLLPLVVAFSLRRKVTAQEQRKHERFQIDSAVEIKVGDKKLKGEISTISLGGAAIDVDAMLDQGSVVTMRIASPDGKDQIEVQGHIVWSDQHQKYGVQFDEVKQSALQVITAWTRNLVKI